MNASGGRPLVRASASLFLRGVVLGAAVGTLGLLAPGIGLILAVAGVILLAAIRPRYWAPSGFLIAAGTSWLLLLWRAASSCRVIANPNYSADCRPPDLAPYVAVAGLWIVIGFGLLVVAGARRRSEYAGTDGLP